ncbi:CVNH domain-containing protein [Hirsutella rhossiliensis]|uniref:CVNH domain-containing protein n=1 Tax=Hirsutella rhossiliensis TaxID=111463 RepID=A0A9P8MZW5_9HYPO|nr:CVNH domain-containing protein [Hirsutella rhossiliensis]KAH0965113.1 CVNH domain-containing protein [Hirsutella rhossiliensis]
MAASPAAPQPAPEAPATLHRRAGFAASCREYWLNSKHTATLQARCRQLDGKDRLSTLFLNDCLQNNDGRLWGNRQGKYSVTCDTRTCVLHGTRIECKCRKGGGVWVATSTDLSEFVAGCAS